MKLFFPFYVLLLFCSCNQEPVDLAENELTAGLETRQKDPGKKQELLMCHLENNGEYKVIPVTQKELIKRLAKGDYELDVDGDGFTAVGACSGSRNDSDDTNPEINPDAAEVCDNSIDDDSDGLSDCDDPDCTSSCAICPCFVLADLNCDSLNIYFSVCDLDSSIYIKGECFKLFIGENVLGQNYVSFGTCSIVLNSSEFDACRAIARQAILDHEAAENCNSANTEMNIFVRNKFDQNKVSKKYIPPGSH